MNALKTIGITLVALTLSSTALAGHHKDAKDIVDTAAEAGNFKTLIAAAKAAGLAGALKGDGPLTVFAPTDEAFSALQAGTIDSLLKPANRDKLATILKYHVISGKVGSGALADGARLETLAGANAVISRTEGGFNIENARIIATDIDASNGIVHVIDRVILPPEQLSRAASAEAIQMAIDRGVPMFNHGNPRGTVSVYMDVAERLLSAGDLNSAEIVRLERGISEAEDARNARAAAWQLRYALDDVSDSLHGNSRMDTSTAMAR